MADPKPLPTDGPNLAQNVVSAVKNTHWSGKDGVWDGIKKVVTGKNSYETDKVDATFKMLQTSAIATNTAMPGQIPGSRQEVIRGNSVLTVTGERYAHIESNDKQLVDGTSYEQTKGNAEFVFLANRYLNVTGDEQHLVYGNQDIFILGPSTQQFVGKHELTAPEEFEWKQFERGFSALKLDIALLGVDAHIAALDLHVIDLEICIFDADPIILGMKIGGPEVETKALKLEISLELDIKFRGDILVDLGTGTPIR